MQSPTRYTIRGLLALSSVPALCTPTTHAGTVTEYDSASAWKGAVDCWSPGSAAYDSFFQGVEDGDGCLIPGGGVPGGAAVDLSEGTITVRAFDSRANEVCPIEDAATPPQVSDGVIPSGGMLELTFSPDITAYFTFYGSLAVGATATMSLYDAANALVGTATSNAPIGSGAIGHGFTSTVPIRRLEITTTEEGVVYQGVFVFLAGGVSPLGTVTIPGYSGPNGATVDLDFAARFQAPPAITVPDDYNTIQAAVDAAAFCGTEIVVRPGTYNGDIVIVDKLVHLRSSGGPLVTTIFGVGQTAVCLDGDMILEGFTITSAGARGGDGGLETDGNPTITDCRIMDNNAFFGGGVFNRGNPTFTNCAFIGNSANFAGAVFSDLGDPTFTNCTFTGNSAVFESSAIRNNLGTPVITNCTFTGNSASGGGVIDDVQGPAFSITNCIVWGNTPTGLEGGVNATYSNIQGGHAGDGNIDADPMFGGSNCCVDTGGAGCDDPECEALVCEVNPFCCFVWDQACADLAVDQCGVCGPELLPGSPCIDAGDNDAPGLAGITTDFFGNPRFVDDAGTVDTGNPPGGGPIIDMGAFEFQGTSCPWDCGDNDASVGIVDFLALLAQWGGPGSCDFDGGGVGITDFLALLANWGRCP